MKMIHLHVQPHVTITSHSFIQWLLMAPVLSDSQLSGSCSYSFEHTDIPVLLWHIGHWMMQINVSRRLQLLACSKLGWPRVQKAKAKWTDIFWMSAALLCVVLDACERWIWLSLFFTDEEPRLGNVIDLIQDHASREINLLWCLQNHSRCDHVLLGTMYSLFVHLVKNKLKNHFCPC